MQALMHYHNCLTYAVTDKFNTMIYVLPLAVKVKFDLTLRL